MEFEYLKVAKAKTTPLVSPATQKRPLELFAGEPEDREKRKTYDQQAKEKIEELEGSGEGEQMAPETTGL